MSFLGAVLPACMVKGTAESFWRGERFPAAAACKDFDLQVEVGGKNGNAERSDGSQLSARIAVDRMHNQVAFVLLFMIYLRWFDAKTVFPGGLEIVVAEKSVVGLRV